MRCGCEKPYYGGDTGEEPAYLAWTGPQMGNVHNPRQRDARTRRDTREARPVVLQLLSRREVVFDARAGQIESVPLPAFDTAAYGTWVLSVAVSVKTAYAAGNQLKVWVQNVAVDEDDPAVVFAGDGPSVTITASPAAPHLLTSTSSSQVGPQARLLIQWTQGTGQFNPPTAPVARTVVSAWLTLRPKSKPPAT